MNKIKNEKIFLFMILILSTVLNFLTIDKIETSNPFYSTSVNDITKNSNNFFLVSFDLDSLTAKDKPSLVKWLQEISGKLFGPNELSTLIPRILVRINLKIIN